MAVPSSGEITIHGLAKEKVYDNYSSTSSVTGPISLYDLTFGLNANGSGVSFDQTNTDSPSYPNITIPHSASEWYSYDHDYAATVTVNMTGAYAITTANTSGDTMRLSKGVDGVQTATYSNTNASTYQQISASNTIGYGVDASGRNYYEVYRNGITYQSGTLAIYLTAPSGYDFSNHSVSQYNCSATSLTQSSTNFSYTATQGSQTIDYMYARLYFDLVSNVQPVTIFTYTTSYVKCPGNNIASPDTFDNRFYSAPSGGSEIRTGYHIRSPLFATTYYFNNWDDLPDGYDGGSQRFTSQMSGRGTGTSNKAIVHLVADSGQTFSNISYSFIGANGTGTIDTSASYTNSTTIHYEWYVTANQTTTEVLEITFNA